ncbi:uncharacterized protein LOC108669358 isoform X2 [Hyalella azteca]|uniref:Uncharacterized protein LOC108669358 isoform X2 n=1 Tax=Hyalella azteca TaxID=294128 RepID=A0A8B7NEX8_HYAAZ|nr:uncharacterized protein LOC108669358 isoform X2 [Hyalella azteca]
MHYIKTYNRLCMCIQHHLVPVVRPVCKATLLSPSHTDSSLQHSWWNYIRANKLSVQAQEKSWQQNTKSNSGLPGEKPQSKKDACKHQGSKGQDQDYVHKNKVKSHFFSSIYPWSTKVELAEHLLQSQIFNNDDLLVLNKPYGVGQVHTGSRTCYGPAPPPFTLQDVLPIIKEITKENYLSVVVAPEKWHSGILILAKKAKVGNKMKYCLKKSVKLQVCPKEFWCITRNRAYPKDRSYRQAALRAEVIDSSVKVVGVTRTMHHSLRVWLSHHLAPPLGDHLFGTRVAYLLNTPVPVPHTRAKNIPPYNFKLLQELDLMPSIQDLIPLMIHLRTVTLSGFYERKPANQKERDLSCFTSLNDTKLESPTVTSLEVRENQQGGPNDEKKPVYDNEKDLVFVAPLPQHFKWTLEKLGIEIPASS